MPLSKSFEAHLTQAKEKQVTYCFPTEIALQFKKSKEGHLPSLQKILLLPKFGKKWKELSLNKIFKPLFLLGHHIFPNSKTRQLISRSKWRFLLQQL